MLLYEIKMNGKIMLLVFVVFFLGVVEAGLYYDVEVNFDSGEMSIDSVDVLYSRFEEGNFHSIGEESTDYNFLMEDDSGKVVYSEILSIPNVQIVDYIDDDTGEIMSSEVIVLENKSFRLYFPYQEKVNIIVVNDLDGGLVEEFEVRSFAKIKANVSDGLGDVKDADVLEEKSSNFFFYFILFVILVLVVVLVVVFYIRKK